MQREKIDDQAFADLVEADRSTICRIRNGSHKPSAALMERIANQTGGLVQPNDYFDGLPEAEAA